MNETVIRIEGKEFDIVDGPVMSYRASIEIAPDELVLWIKPRPEVEKR